MIENYFKHGIDLERFDNAVHINAFRKTDKVLITVSDNGTPMSVEKISELNQKLESQEVELVKGNNSIGLMNVKARMTGTFGSKFKMYVENNEFNGVTVTMEIFVGE